MLAANRFQQFVFAAAAILTAVLTAESPAAARPLLSVIGNLAPSGERRTVEFNRADLEKLGMETIETKTPWYKGKDKFEGVPLETLMRVVGAQGESVTVVALNDYSSEIPIKDFAAYHVILALKRNGEYMPVTDKGPLFIMYPFDNNPELQTQTYYSRAVWQVGKLIVH